jgi:hypothetical protein
VENGTRDTTQEWLLPDRDAPPTVAKLEQRIDEAVAIARASEAAVISVGAAAIESAEQARRAAELAVRASDAASRAAVSAAERGSATSGTGLHGGEGNGVAAEGPAPMPPLEDERMVIFSRRADRVGARFEQLQRR